jgi:hypothetical protein
MPFPIAAKGELAHAVVRCNTVPVLLQCLASPSRYPAISAGANYCTHLNGSLPDHVHHDLSFTGGGERFTQAAQSIRLFVTKHTFSSQAELEAFCTSLFLLRFENRVFDKTLCILCVYLTDII